MINRLTLRNFKSVGEQAYDFTQFDLLVVSASTPDVNRTTRETALARNRLVIALATDIVVPHVAAGSPLAALLSEVKT